MADDEATTTTTAPAATSTEVPPNPINLRAPSKYLSDPSKAPTTSSEPFVSPSKEWLHGTWTVTHSTLSMWRSAQNVRITYQPHIYASTVPFPTDGNGPAVNDNLVEYEKKGGKGGVSTVLGIEKPDPNIPGAWNWRGKGWLMIASSHWEILGWGERPLSSGEGVERWAVTWFAPTLFTEEGIDLYSDRKEGLQKETADLIIEALKKLEAPKLVQLVEKKMMEVAISLPWKESAK
ncbi:hypothetical protein O1611_g4488 [Lasiodiplodia mahajangana]|uniref:Uncharacterized protein n=1 Tax=Lasiodiplodia mahajangana TaxID=1108764 RepID=A0ACC2JPF5_9PEZI|nr:hypothetical protein O1611_g4488 [Lasiodiplodia mahajangana]